jgi:Domain of unknown function (DUF4169)
MQADIVNLNRFRKARAKVDKAKQAAENRVKFGRTKAEKTNAASEDKLAVKRLDGKLITGQRTSENTSEPDRE